MTIKKRLLISFGVLIILFVLMTLFSMWTINRILAWEEEIYSVRLISTNRLVEVERDAYRASLALTRLIWKESSGGLETQERSQRIQEIDGIMTQIREHFIVFDNLMDDADEEISQRIIDFYNIELKNFSDWNGDTISRLRQGNLTRALATYNGAYQEAFNALQDSLDILYRYSLDAAEASHRQVKQTGSLVLVINIAAGLLGLLISLAALYFIGRKVLRPIAQVSRNMEQLSGGGGDLTIRLPEAGTDEMAQLSAHVNSFIGKIAEILTGLRNETLKASEVKLGIVSAVEENSTAATQISANLGSIASQVGGQDQGIIRITGNLETMESSVAVFDNQVSEEAAMVEQSTASVTQMIASIQNLSQIAQSRKEATGRLQKTIDQGSLRVQESKDAVQAIVADIGTIREMTGIIATIASQTNLLAMNAAIEAAHAGDAGRGFAVVADEIRKLAETASGQSSSINSVLKRVVGNIEHASTASEFTSGTYGDILSEFRQLSQAFQEITENSLELDSGGKQVLEAMESLREHSISLRGEAGSIRKSNTEIRSEMDEIRNSSRMVNGAVSEITLGVKEMSESLEAMRNQAAVLESSMDRAAGYLELFVLEAGEVTEPWTGSP